MDTLTRIDQLTNFQWHYTQAIERARRAAYLLEECIDQINTCGTCGSTPTESDQSDLLFWLRETQSALDTIDIGDAIGV